MSAQLNGNIMTQVEKRHNLLHNRTLENSAMNVEIESSNIARLVLCNYI